MSKLTVEMIINAKNHLESPEYKKQIWQSRRWIGIMQDIAFKNPTLSDLELHEKTKIEYEKQTEGE